MFRLPEAEGDSPLLCSRSRRQVIGKTSIEDKNPVGPPIT
jgi:hypothetical protein